MGWPKKRSNPFFDLSLSDTGRTALYGVEHASRPQSNYHTAQFTTGDRGRRTPTGLGWPRGTRAQLLRSYGCRHEGVLVLWPTYLNVVQVSLLHMYLAKDIHDERNTRRAC